ncbi:MAG: hypothetical protein HFH15_15520 [Ruminococcus sp.]|nr:hypothetical protein [Ruminococcus sp.]
MLEGVESMFDNMDSMLKKLKKNSYEANMKTFRHTYGHYFQEMTEFVGQSEEKEQAAEFIGNEFAGKVKEKYKSAKNGKIKSYVQADLNFMMIYYVFPALLMTEHKSAKAIADGLCTAWGQQFKDGQIQYTDYDTLYNGFREKIFGIF